MLLPSNRWKVGANPLEPVAMDTPILSNLKDNSSCLGHLEAVSSQKPHVVHGDQGQQMATDIYPIRVTQTKIVDQTQESRTPSDSEKLGQELVQELPRPQNTARSNTIHQHSQTRGAYILSYFIHLGG